jgi:cob(I)alamin adenosyltransferase
MSTLKKASIYTRTGDKGTTGLVSGTRVRKNNLRLQVYGEVDELNSFIGLGISFLDKTFDKTLLYEIQSSLFDLGSNLACEKEKRAQFKLPQIKDSLIEKLERDMDKIDQLLSPQHTFILPGGSPESSFFHVCRTVCRRVERQMIAFEEQYQGEVTESELRFINRLSDYFFILARYINHSRQIEEINWIPKKE